MIEIVPATEELIAPFFTEEQMRARPRLQGWVILEDGAPIALGGLAFHGPFVEVFSETTEAAKKHPVSIYRVARTMMRRVRELGRLTYATRNPDEPTAERLLNRLGFTDNGGGYYLWHS